MLATDRVTWPRRRPWRAVRRLGSLTMVAGLVLAPSWLVFGQEPWRVEGGRMNPLALVFPAFVLLFGVFFTCRVVVLVHRPAVSADWSSLRVRPGVGRTL